MKTPDDLNIAHLGVTTDGRAAEFVVSAKEVDTARHGAVVKLSDLEAFVYTFAPGIEMGDLLEVLVEPSGVTLVVARRDADGRWFAANGEVATVTVTYDLDQEG